MKNINPKFSFLSGLPPRFHPSALYLASAGNVTKVGFSAHVKRRAKTLIGDLESKAGCEFGSFAAIIGSGAVIEEDGLIAKMKERFQVAHGREYFSCNFDEAYPVFTEYCRSIQGNFLLSEEVRYAADVEKQRLELKKAIDRFNSNFQHLEAQIEEHRNYVMHSKVLIAKP